MNECPYIAGVAVERDETIDADALKMQSRIVNV